MTEQQKGLLLAFQSEHVFKPPSTANIAQLQQHTPALGREPTARIEGAVIDVTDQRSIKASELAHSKGVGICADGPPP